MDYIYKSIKFRIYPTPSQIVEIERNINCCRFVYNKLLERHTKAYQRRHENLSVYDMQKIVTEMKSYYPFLKSCDSKALVNMAWSLDTSFKRFYKTKKGYPKFKSAKRTKPSYTTTQHIKVDMESNKVKVPKISWIKSKVSRDIPLNSIRLATISRTKTGKYFISITYKVEQILLPESPNYIGLDLGLSSYLTDSNGNKVGNPKYYHKLEKKLSRTQYRLSKMKKGSNNYEKQRAKLNKIYERIYNLKLDFLHKLSTSIINDNQVICIEDLSISNMVRNHKLSKSIMDSSWRLFVSMLEYKSDWYGRQLIKVYKFYPSTKLCSNCGYKNNQLSLSDREWTCPECNISHDRDINAARNILNEGLRILSL